MYTSVALPDLLKLARSISKIATPEVIADRAIIHNYGYVDYAKLALACDKMPISEVLYVGKHKDHHEFNAEGV